MYYEKSLIVNIENKASFFFVNTSIALTEITTYKVCNIPSGYY